MEDLGTKTIKVNKNSWLIYRKGSGDTVEILDLVVGNEYRRQGIGRGMVNKLIKEVEVTPTKLVWAITRASNQVAQQFYEEMGFHVVGVLRNFYRDEPIYGVDAIMYGRNL